MIGNQGRGGGQIIVDKDEYNYFTEPDMKPIILSRNTIALIHLYTRYGEFIEMVLNDNEENWEKIMEESAKELVRQLKLHWCDAFMLALIKEIKENMKGNYA